MSKSFTKEVEITMSKDEIVKGHMMTGPYMLRMSREAYDTGDCVMLPCGLSPT